MRSLVLASGGPDFGPQMAAATVAAAGWCCSDSRPVCLQSHVSGRRSDVGPNINEGPATTNHTLAVSLRGTL